jgi:preprotein translocase subunit SecF
MRIFEDLHVDFLGKRKYFYILSAILLVVGLADIIFFRGLHFGIDFKGGTEIALQFEKPVDLSNVRSYVEKMGLGEVELKSFGGSQGILLRTELQEVPHTLVPKIVGIINTTINTSFPNLQPKTVQVTNNSITYHVPNKDTLGAVVDEVFRNGFQSGRVTEDSSNTSMIVRFGIADWIKANLKQVMPDNQFQVLKEQRGGAMPLMPGPGLRSRLPRQYQHPEIYRGNNRQGFPWCL